MPAAVVSIMIGGACPSVTGSSIVGMKCVVGYIGDWVQRAGTGRGGGVDVEILHIMQSRERVCARRPSLEQ